MAEAIITRRSGAGSDRPKYTLLVKTVIENESFVVPNARDQKFSVRIFGGGGGGSISGGGGGWMNNADLELEEGLVIPIVIGTGGKSNSYVFNSGGSTGGSTSFGTYLSANGGTGGRRQTSVYWGNGGSGGSGGGGFGGYRINTNAGSFGRGGIGYQFGGGAPGGNGGIWGGGGAGVIGMVRPNDNRSSNNQKLQVTIPGGKGGTYGGDGTTKNNGNNGTNTINDNSVDPSYRGNGIGGKGMATPVNILSLFENFDSGVNAQTGGGGGGYGGNGGSCISNGYVYGGGASGGAYYASIFAIPGGGGGGYGANGGSIIITYDNTSTISIQTFQGMGGGGGGGYGMGGQGGNGCLYTAHVSLLGTHYGYGGGGGGYGCGAEADGEGYSKTAGYGGGGSGNIPGGQGICIIQYYGIAEES